MTIPAKRRAPTRFGLLVIGTASSASEWTKWYLFAVSKAALRSSGMLLRPSITITTISGQNLGLQNMDTLTMSAISSHGHGEGTRESSHAYPRRCFAKERCNMSQPRSHDSRWSTRSKIIGHWRWCHWFDPWNGNSFGQNKIMNPLIRIRCHLPWYVYDRVHLFHGPMIVIDTFRSKMTSFLTFAKDDQHKKFVLKITSKRCLFCSHLFLHFFSIFWFVSTTKTEFTIIGPFVLFNSVPRTPFWIHLHSFMSISCTSQPLWSSVCWRYWR